MLSSAMTRSLDFLVALFTDFSPIFGGPGGAAESESPAERRSSRHQENWFLSRLQSTFSPNASPNRRRCNSDASACHILCLSQFYCHHFITRPVGLISLCVYFLSLPQFGGQSTDKESRRHESGSRGGLLWHELGGPEPELWPRRRWKGAEHQHGGHVH